VCVVAKQSFFIKITDFPNHNTVMTSTKILKMK